MTRHGFFGALLALVPATLSAQPSEPPRSPPGTQADSELEFSHNGSFVVSVDDEGELSFARGLLRFDVVAGDRVEAVVRLDFRSLIAKARIRRRLRSSPDLIAAITHAIKLRISAQTGIKDLRLIVVPQPVIDEQVEEYVESRITRSAVTETTIREAFFRAGLNGKISDIGRGVRLAILEIGKVEPLHQTETNYASNPTQGLYYFAVAQPAVRLLGQLSRRTTIYGQVSNDRHGAVEDPSGSDVIGFTRELITRSSGELLEYTINSQEAGVVHTIAPASVILSVGRRPQRDFLTRGELDDNYYGVAMFKANVQDFNLQFHGSVEGADSAASVKRANAVVSRTLMRDLVAVGTQVFVRDGGDLQSLFSWLAGANVKLIRREQFEFGVGAKYSRFKVGDDWGSRAEAGVGFGWSFR